MIFLGLLESSSMKFILTLISAILAVGAPSWLLIEKSKQCWRVCSSPMIEYQDEAGFSLGTSHLSPAKVLTTKTNLFSLNAYTCCLAFWCWFLWLHALYCFKMGFRNGVTSVEPFPTSTEPSPLLQGI
jgi:hypothetical protein